MKQLFILLCMTLFYTGVIKAQVGLENVVIETYYVANATDIAYSGVDPLPAGAVTYRVYVDMIPGWELQAVFGSTNVGTGEVDTFVVRSTAPFWNHTDFGGLYGYNTQASRLDDNTVALDSWFSTGRSSGSTGGTSAVLEVVPSEDTNGGAPMHPHTPVDLLTNNAAAAGLPLTTEDGNIPFTSTITWTPTPGIEGILDPVFNNVNSPATQVVVSDGALGVTVSLQGPTAANRICIGQFTTAGILSGQLNLQIRNITTLEVETYVAQTPGANQFTHPSLVFGPNANPTVTITNPTDGQNFGASVTVNIAATATDSDGTISQVQFFKDGVSIATVPGPGPYTTSFVTGLVTTTHQIVARATDNEGGINSDTVNITVTGNNPPAVVLTAPSSAITGTTVNVSATATDSDGSVASVQFFFNNTAISPVIAFPGPYTASFTATPAGTYTGVNGIRAVAIDNAGASGTATQNITISNNTAPTASVTAPANGSFVSAGPVTVTANANDTDGSIAQVEFFVNGVSIGIDLFPGPYTTTWNAVFVGPFGSNTITAVSTDNLGLTGTSAAVNVNVIDPAGSPYAVESIDQVCNEATVCIPISAVGSITDVIGFDMTLTWDDTQIYPTGNIIKSSDFMNPAFYETDNSIDFVNDEMLVSVFLDVDAPVGTSFTGTGELVCIEFAKRIGFQSVDTTVVTVTNMQESYFNGVLLKNPVLPGTFTTFRNTIMNGNIEFWDGQKPIGNDGLNTSPTIQANTAFDCSLASAANPSSLTGPVVLPGANGVFTYDMNGGVKFSIGKSIAPTTDVQEVINGFDALLTRRLIIDDASFTPSIYQAIAMDVNRDGVISAGDVSQINQRAVLIIDEFRQQWNYNADGSQKPTYSVSKDWQFIDNSTVSLNPSYQVSSAFPNDNGTGYSKHRVPKVPFCLTAPVANFANCPETSQESYTGILYGDVNGNWKNTTDILLRTDESVNVGIDQAVYEGNFVDVPVTFNSSNDIHAIDLNLDFDASKYAYHSILADNMQAVGHYNGNDAKLRITSNSLKTLLENEVAFVVRFTRVNQSKMNTKDFNASTGYLNGDKVNVNLLSSGKENDDNITFNLYPNPVSNVLFLNVSHDVTAEIIDMNGRVIMSGLAITANISQPVNISNLSNGIYTMRIIHESYTSAQRFVVQK